MGDGDRQCSWVTEWRVCDMGTGELTDVRLSNGQSKSAWHGYEPPRTAWDAHRIMAHGTVIDRGGDRMRYGGATDDMRKRLLLRGWGRPRSAEDRAPRGWAADWFTMVLDGLYSNSEWLDPTNGQSRRVPPSGVTVAQQLARLAGDGREVTISERSLSDAVGRRDHAGRERAYTQSGIGALLYYGFIEKQVTGRGRAAKTTYQLVRP